MRIKFDNVHNPINPTIVLATKGGRRLGQIPAKNVAFRDSMNDGSEVSFKVYQADCPDLWNLITDFKCVWVRDWNRWFEIEVDMDDSGYMSKNVTAVSLGRSELSQIILYDKEINTEDDIARDDFVPTVFFRPEDPKSSLLHRLIEKAPHYRIGHVDTSIASIQRTFSFDDKSIADAMDEVSEEIECLIQIDCYTDSNGVLQREINAYDLKPHCLECGARGDFTEKCDKCGSANIDDGYGKDTSIFVSTENLADSIKYKVDTGSVKNCFRLEAGDELTTAAVISCNPNGSGYIWYISDKTKEDMSDALVAKLNAYDEMYDMYQNTNEVVVPADLMSQYNGLITKYADEKNGYKKMVSPIIGYPLLMEKYFDVIDFGIYLNNKMMPDPSLADTTAAEQLVTVTDILLDPVAVKNLDTCSVTTAESAVMGILKAVVDSRYKIRISDSAYANGLWSGIVQLTSYADESDTVTSDRLSCEVNDDYETYVKQKILKTVGKSSSDEAYDIVGILNLPEDRLAVELKKYCLSRLTAFRDVCQSCVDILIEHGISDPDKWAYDVKDLYTGLYVPYYNKLHIIEEEIKVREGELFIITGQYDTAGELIVPGMQTLLAGERDSIQTALNFEAYLGTDLMKEFASFRREDTYRNTNYVSDGLNNAELFQLALEFVKNAKNEIVKSSTLQHSISADVKNLLVMKEFEPIVQNFEIGNWIRIKTDDMVYKLRLIEYEIDFDNLDNFSVEFSDLVVAGSSVSDVESIIDQASSMASSYDYVARQAKQGEKGNAQMSDWVDRGLEVTKVKIIDSADNQNISWDNHGLLCKEYLPITDTYDDKQLKIINRGLYLTDDGWKTSKAGIGDFTFWNPKTGKMEQSYGVIADVIVGNIVLSEEVGIYNKNNSMTMDEHGLTITASPSVDQNVKQLLLVQKEKISPEGVKTYDKLLYLDDNGDLVMNGSIRINSTSSQVGSIDDVVNNSIISVVTTYAESESGITAPETGWQASIPVVAPGHFLWTKNETEYGSGEKKSSYTVSRQGVNGVATMVIQLFRRSSSPVSVDWTHDVNYTFGTHTLTPVPKNWSTTIPEGTDPIYVTAATVASTEPTDVVAASEWSEPVVMAKDGESGSNGINSATVFLYIRSAGLPAKPKKDIMYTFATNELSETDGWFTSIPDGSDPVYVTVVTAISNKPSVIIEGEKWSEPVVMARDGKDGTDGQAGNDGLNSASVFLYQRSSTVPDAPSTQVTYSFTEGKLIELPEKWSMTIVEGVDPLYVTTATAVSTKSTDIIDPSEWSVPTMMVKDGEKGKDGDAGTNGVNTATVYLYARSNTLPSKPSKPSVYTFSTSSLSETDGWFETVPSGTEPLYVTVATAASNQATDTIAPNEWSEPVVMARDGKDGTDGQAGNDGLNSASVFLYQRSSTVPDAPRYDSVYTFATGELSNTDGWYISIPDGVEPVYVTVATAASSEATDTIGANEWSDPVIMAKNGQDGSSGSNGLNTASIFLYKRDSAVPARPSIVVTYTFATKTLSSTDGWFLTIPGGSDPLYVTTATAVSSEPTDMINPEEWSVPVIMAQNGQNGLAQYLHIKYSNDGASFTPNDGNDIGAYIGTLVNFDPTPSMVFGDYTWKKFTEDTDAELEEIRRNIDETNKSLQETINGTANEIYEAINQESTNVTNRLDSSIADLSSSMTKQMNDVSASIELKYSQLIEETNDVLKAHTAEIGQYMQFNENGLTLGATSSRFKTIIDNTGMYFKEGNTIVSYVNNSQLHIPNAVIESTLILGKFFFSPRSDGGVSLTWQD